MMKGADRLIFGFMALAAVAVAFWFLALSPKRQEAAKLSDEVTDLEDSVSAQEQAAEFGEQARSDYPRHYGRLVSLGKAVPDQAALRVPIGQLAAGTVVAAIAGVLAAIGPARRAARLDVLAAIATE